MIPNVGPLELAIVLIIALIVFGPRRLPELGSSLGKGIRSYKGAIADGEEKTPAAEGDTSVEAESNSAEKTTAK